MTAKKESEKSSVRLRLSRRDFIRSASQSVAVLTIAPWHGAMAASPDPQTDDTLRILSGESQYAPLPGHLHYLDIPLEVFEEPPVDGVELTTTRAYAHRHKVVLTQEQIQHIADGGAVLAEDTVGDHLYDIRFGEDE
jgi:hypothetical protein